MEFQPIAATNKTGGVMLMFDVLAKADGRTELH